MILAIIDVCLFSCHACDDVASVI